MEQVGAYRIESDTMAIKAFERSFAQKAPDPESLYYCGLARARLGDAEGAVKDLSRAKADCGQPTDRPTAALLAHILLARADALHLLARREEARADCQRILELFEGTTNLGSRAQATLERIGR